MYVPPLLPLQTNDHKSQRYACTQSSVFHHSLFIIADDLVALALAPIGSRMALAILLTVHRSAIGCTITLPSGNNREQSVQMIFVATSKKKIKNTYK
ncbi:unnamed protein product [Ectocarpus sp. 6 AP-2014]